jgi:hypothetical protein
MAVELSAAEWVAVDRYILAGNILRALKTIRGLRAVSLKEAIDIHFERYKRLRAERPGDFACSHEEYWQGVYS